MQHVTPILELRPEPFQYAAGASRHSPFSEAEEMELALELLAITSEAELDQFLGNLISKAWTGIKKVGSQIARPLGGILKAVAKTALPWAATAAGTFFGGPVGGAIGGKLGSLVSQALEAETAPLPAEDRDLEKCRQFVRMAGNAVSAAAAAPAGTNPIALAQKVLARSAQQKLAAPPAGAGTGGGTAIAASPAASADIVPAGQQKTRTASPTVNRACSRCGHSQLDCQCGPIAQSGRWMRHGRSIVIVNC